MTAASVGKIPVLRLVESMPVIPYSKTRSPSLDRKAYLFLIRDSLESELASIKSWAPEGAWVVEVIGRKPQMRWPDPVRKDKKGNPKVRSTCKFNLKDWPEMQLNRSSRYELLAEIKEINQLIQKRYK